jgi:ligand-binding sensor domain-containing protein
MSALFLAFLVSAGVSYQWGFQTSQSYISSIVEDDDGTMWCATSGGIVHYDPVEGWLQPMVYPDGFPWIGACDIYFQDSLMWAATDGGGLALLDGDGWRVFSSYEGIPGTGVVHTVHGAGGYIWAGTDGGLARGGPEGFTVIDSDITGGAFEADEVTGISSLGDTMYLATDRGVYALDLNGSVFDPASWTSYTVSTISLGIRDFLVHSPDSVFGYGSGGVSIMTGGAWTRILDYSTSQDSVITGLLMTEDGLIASGRVVIVYNGGSWVHYGEGYPDESYGSCLHQALGRIWCGYGIIDASASDAGRGLGYLQDGSWTSLPVPGMGGASCYQMVRDGERTYLGSHRMGLMASYPDLGWTQFNRQTAAMPRALRCYSAAVTDSPGVWTGAYHWGLTWIGDRGTFPVSDDTVITFVSDSLPGLPPEVVQVVCPMLNNQVVMLASQAGDLWVAQEAYWQTPDEPSGLVAVSGNPEDSDLRWAARTEADGLAGRNIERIFPCGEDSLWISFASDGGCQLLVHGGDPADKSYDTWYPGPGEAYTTSWGLPSGQVFCFARDLQGSVLLGTGNGICRWNGSVFVEIDGPEGSVKAMEVDRYGAVWCMTEDAVCCIDASGTTEYTSSNSIFIPANRTENEFSYRDPVTGTLYFSSLVGLWSIDPGQASHQGSSPLFYPQPFLPAAEDLRMAWSGERGAVSARFFSLTGEYLGTLEAESWEEWSWNGTLDGEELSSGLYFVIVETMTGTTTNKIALVR